MFNFEKKLEDLGYNIGLFEDETVDLFRHALAGLAKAAQSEWIRLAQTRLKTSRELYVNGLRQAESFMTGYEGSEPNYTITLVGHMPNAIEQGKPSYDMKSIRPGWLGGKKAKTAKDGSRYVVIPFRHSISSTSRLAYSGKAAAMDLQKELRKTVKEYGLDRMIRAATGKVIKGPVKKVPNRPEVHRYLRGLTRIQQPIEGRTKAGLGRGTSTLMTWRVMSENSPADSWIQPDLQPRNILASVESWVDKESEQIIERIMSVA